MMNECKLCRLRTAVFPDRNTMSRRVCICRECYSERLRIALRTLLKPIISKQERDEG